MGRGRGGGGVGGVGVWVWRAGGAVEPGLFIFIT